MQASFDLAALWAQGDGVAHATLILLLMMSLVSWTLILAKAWQLTRLRSAAPRVLERFWNAASLDEGLHGLRDLPAFARLAEAGSRAMRHARQHATEGHSHLDSHLSTSELVTRALRHGIQSSSSRLENGQAWLASIGATAPFIGLFGTVWGIHHALLAIGTTGQAGLDQVAGPVGEALIMTALGLFVAIPAVLAYNAFNRALRVVGADLDGFAHDLHAFFTLGQPDPDAACQFGGPCREPVTARAEAQEAA
ncbi:MAG: MotA/TolQ/ExbB proton channel family protein [Pseudomonadota bacterium]